MIQEAAWNHPFPHLLFIHKLCLFQEKKHMINQKATKTKTYHRSHKLSSAKTNTVRGLKLFHYPLVSWWRNNRAVWKTEMTAYSYISVTLELKLRDTFHLPPTIQIIFRIIFPIWLSHRKTSRSDIRISNKIYQTYLKSLLYE